MSDLVLHRGVGRDTCRSCKASIVWVYTTAGKKAPFELDPKGEWNLENGTARHVGPPPAQLELGAPKQADRYTSHFSVCPQAGEWRKPK